MALVDPGEHLASAARASLEPWGVEVLAIPPPSPGASMPATSEAARAVALAHGAAAVVWVSVAGDSHALWIYDLESDSVTARRLLTPPPFDAPVAAAVALSIKTLLRHSAVAPEADRLVAPSEDRAPVALRDHARTAVQRADTPPHSDSHLDFAGHASARFDRTQPGTIELRVGFGLWWWPGSGPIGLAFRLASGPGVGVDHELFRGRFVDTEISLAGALRWSSNGALRVSLTAGLSTHVTLLEGTVLSDAQPAESIRVDPSLDAELGIDWLVTRSVRIGMRGGLSWLLLTQRYLVRGNTILTLSALAFEAGLSLGAMLPE